MSIPHPIPWFFLLAIVVVAKLAVLVLLCRRLRQAFPSVWNDLGRPFSFERYMPSTSFSQGLTEQNAQWSLLFYIFSGQYRDLHDRTVALLVASRSGSQIPSRPKARRGDGSGTNPMHGYLAAGTQEDEPCRLTGLKSLSSWFFCGCSSRSSFPYLEPRPSRF
jgi:hypothetical protein